MNTEMDKINFNEFIIRHLINMDVASFKLTFEQLNTVSRSTNC